MELPTMRHAVSEPIERVGSISTNHNKLAKYSLRFGK